MGTCTLFLLGPPQVGSDERVARIRLRKAVALVAYLAVERRAFSRDFLATLLWPDLGQQGALANLRRTLTLLRTTLGNGCVVTEGDQVEVDQTSIVVDVDQFHSLLHSLSGDSGLARLEAAAALYRGAFLEGFNLADCPAFNEWQDSTREKLEAEFDDLLESVTTAYLRTGYTLPALPFARRWLELDHLNEAAHRALMEIHARMGRSDLARRQYRYCTRLLAREGLEPEDLTRDLRDAIAHHRVAGPASPQAANIVGGQPPPARDSGRLRLRWRRIGLVAAVALAAVAMVNVYFLRTRIFGSDPAVSALEVVRKGDQASALRVLLQNEGVPVRKLSFTVVFTADEGIGWTRDYEVYSGAVRIGWNGRVALEIGIGTDIARYLDGAGMRLPPGYYTSAVILDPEQKIAERSELNNRLESSDRFFYDGVPEAAFDVEIRYEEPDPLDDANPLRVFIGDLTEYRGTEDWGQFRVSTAGRYYFPLDALAHRDNNGSGYFLAIVHDAGDNLQGPYFVDPADIAGLYKEVVGNIVFGAFTIGDGTPVHPGERYTVDFHRPAPPGPDAFEPDDVRELATQIRYADLPVRQYHTFHDEGTGDSDADWFRIFLRAGASLTAETFSAGGRWESDTAIDLADSRMDYIASNSDKALRDNYSKLTYVNSTGLDQFFYFLVKPRNEGNDIGRSDCGEYVVEFRP